MRNWIILVLALLALLGATAGAGTRPQQPHLKPASPLEAIVDRFDVSDVVMRGGVSELSLKGIGNLHLGFEEIIRERIQDDPRAKSPHFSLHLVRRSVRDILDELCNADLRYVWSVDGATINVYPRATAEDPAYLLNLWIDKISVGKIPDPDQALTSLWKLFPTQQIGYSGPGLADNRYAEPWTTTIRGLTVRQFINRLAEHMGSQTSWVWRGGHNERLFTFLRGGFYTGWEAQPK